MATVLERYRARLLAFPEVLSVGSSLDQDGYPIILVTLKSQGLPNGFPVTLDGVPVVIRTAARHGFLGTGYRRPAAGGDSIGVLDMCTPTGCDYPDTGTLGKVLLDRDGWPYILSCNHVLARNDLRNLGKSVIQPGPADNGTLSDAVARVIDFSFWDSSNQINYDLGLAKALSPDLMQDTVVPGLGNIGPWFEDPILGGTIRKSGRTTGVTTGVISSIDQSLKVDTTIIGLNIGEILFHDLVSVEGSFGGPGDSGSAVYNENLNCIGLLFYGAENVIYLVPTKQIKSYVESTGLRIGVSYPQPKISSNNLLPWAILAGGLSIAYIATQK